jgi:hypothetical protein
MVGNENLVQADSATNGPSTEWTLSFEHAGMTAPASPDFQMSVSRSNPWYRQNIFSATYVPTMAGQEPRIAPVIHPDMLRVMFGLTQYLTPRLRPAIRWLLAKGW